jgi:signal transduction histidine kinase
MFHSTRLKLTAWYLLIIMFISMVFSVVIYVDVNRELVRFENFQQIRQDRLKEDFGELKLPPMSLAVDLQLISEARARLIASLVILNAFILGGSAIAGYFLAGRTLKPIKEMLDDQSRFVGDASHELKTPLTALRSEIEVHLRSKKSTLKEANEVLKSNLEEVMRLQSLTDSLMELTTFESTGLRTTFERVLLSDVLSQSIKNIEPMAKAKKIEIVNRSVKMKIFGNEQSLVRLFTILLDNAIKYSSKNKKVTITSGILDESMYVRIADQGIGIAPTEIDKVFNRFYRIDKSRNSLSVPGYGLGLAIAREIVQRHSGSISVKSSGRGSVFSVEFPV